MEIAVWTSSDILYTNDQIWAHLFKTNSCINFSILNKIVDLILSIPTSNAFCERNVQLLSNLWTKIDKIRILVSTIISLVQKFYRFGRAMIEKNLWKWQSLLINTLDNSVLHVTKTWLLPKLKLNQERFLLFSFMFLSD